MAFRDLFRAVRRAPNSFPDAPPLGEDVEQESIEVRAVRACMAKVFEAREAHGPVVDRKECIVKELNDVTGNRASAQARLAAREKAIALAGGKLPDDPFPEDAEIARLNRHVRILQERVRVCEGAERESQDRIDAAIGDLEKAWCALGTSTGDRLLKNFRDGAAALRDAQLSYLSLERYFNHAWNSAVWKALDKNLVIRDPGSRTLELILNPLHAQLAARWPAGVQSLQKDLADLRAEIDAVKSGEASVSAAETQQED